MAVFSVRRGQGGREGSDLSPRRTTVGSLKLAFRSPTEISLWERQPGVKGQGWRVHWSGLRKQ